MTTKHKLSKRMNEMLHKVPNQWHDAGFFMSPTNRTAKALLKRGLIEFKMVIDKGQTWKDTLFKSWQWRRKH